MKIYKLKVERDQLRAMCEKLEGALKFYADRDNWTQVSAQQCSSMVGGDDHDTCTNEKGSKFTGGHRARRALAEYEKLKGAKGDLAAVVIEEIEVEE